MSHGLHGKAALEGCGYGGDDYIEFFLIINDYLTT